MVNPDPPPLDKSDFFEFLTPSPLGSISDIFEVDNVLMVVDPLGQTSKMAYFHRKRLDFILKKKVKTSWAELS